MKHDYDNAQRKDKNYYLSGDSIQCAAVRIKFSDITLPPHCQDIVPSLPKPITVYGQNTILLIIIKII